MVNIDTRQIKVYIKSTTRLPYIVLVFDWIAGSSQVAYSNQGQVVRKPVNANPGLE